MELISICRLFVQAEEQSIDAGKELRNSLQVVDDALSSATDPNKKDSEKVDALEAAVQALSNYESKFHHRRDSDRTVSKRMEAVKKKHESSSKIWDTMKQKLRERERPTEAERSEPTTVVEFLLLKSPLDPKPSIVKQVISKTSSISEILWNFSRFRDERRVTLKQNPHFYMNLPTSAEAYGDGFKIDPMKDLQHVPKICVLTDKPSRVFLETDETTRTFSNFWIPSRAIIFKDVCGKLEGESVVGAAIQGKPNLWYREEPPTPTTPQPEVGPTANLASHSGLSPNTATSPTSSIAGRTFHDWKELIRQTLDSHHISIRISTKQNQTPPGPSDDWVLSSPISPSPASLGQPSPMVQAIPVGTMSFSIGLDKTRASLSIQIPVPSAGPSTPYKTALSTPISEQAQNAALPFRLQPTPAQPSPTALSTRLSEKLLQMHPTTPARASLTMSSPRGTAHKQEAQVLPFAREAPIQSQTVTMSPLPLLTINRTTLPKATPAPPGPRTDDSQTESGGIVTSQAAAPSLEHGQAASPPPNTGDMPDTPPPSQGQNTPQSQPQARKKNWFQKYVWDYKKGSK